jgi:hypothetical protein
MAASGRDPVRPEAARTEIVGGQRLSVPPFKPAMGESILQPDEIGWRRANAVEGNGLELRNRVRQNARRSK